MSSQELLITLIVLAAILVMALTALLIWAVAMLLRIQDIERKLTGFRPRDGSGRPLRERF